MAQATNTLKPERAPVALTQNAGEAVQSQFAIAWKRFKRNRAALFSSLIVFGYLLVAVIGPLIAPRDPTQRNSGKNDLPPVFVSRGTNGKAGNSDFLLGTDNLGRDVFSKIIYGTRTAIAVGIVPTTIVLLIGALIGYVAGLSGGTVDNVLMRVTDVFYAIPIELILILVMITMGDTILGKTA